jgi:hypothetical protein
LSYSNKVSQGVCVRGEVYQSDDVNINDKHITFNILDAALLQDISCDQYEALSMIDGSTISAKEPTSIYFTPTDIEDWYQEAYRTSLDFKIELITFLQSNNNNNRSSSILDLEEGGLLHTLQEAVN